MSKIICDVCGTSYPETATQCPICGCVRSSDTVTVAGDTSEVTAKPTTSSSYNYVKGGRFSKANVKKRNAGKTLHSTEAPKKTQATVPVKGNNTVSGAMPPVEKPKQSSLAPMTESKPAQTKSAQNKQPAVRKDVSRKNGKKGEIGLVIAIVALLFAIAGVAIYIACKYLQILPNETGRDKPGTSQQAQVDTTKPDEAQKPCTALKLGRDRVEINSAGGTHLLNVTAEPAGQNYTFTYESSDTAVATVNENGVVTAVGRGSATITVKCGDQVASLEVYCNIEDTQTPPETTEPSEPTPTFTAADLTFVDNGFGYDYSAAFSEGTFSPYNGNIPVELIVFTSDNEAVATVDETGLVTFVGRGIVVITAAYNDWKIECIIRVG